MATYTSTQSLVRSVLAELQSHLPTALATYSLPTPNAWMRGEPEIGLVPITNTPLVAVDAGRLSQQGGIGGQGQRESFLIVRAMIAGSDPETVADYLQGYTDVLISVLESQVTIGTLKLTITDGDNSINFAKANAIFRECAVEAKLRTTRSRGDA